MKHLKENNIVAIVGSHPVGRVRAPFDNKEIDIWGFNEAGSAKWMKRVSGLFQIHLPPIWKNPKNVNDPGHYEFLQKDHGYPIFMQEKYPEVPNSVKYPLDEICNDLLPGLVRGEDQPERHFTSSPAYAIAYAIYLGYEEIHLYGIEMTTQTEYVMQRDGITFWLGIALSKGIKVRIQEKSTIFKGLSYGYEGDVVLHRQYFETYESKLSKKSEEMNTVWKIAQHNVDLIAKRLAGATKAEEKELSKRYSKAMSEHNQALVNLGIANGALALCRECLGQIDEMIQAVGGEKAIEAMMPDAMKKGFGQEINGAKPKKKRNRKRKSKSKKLEKVG